MVRLFKFLILLLMMATVLHLPVPVCDTEAAPSHAGSFNGLCFPESRLLGWLDIDYIFLGCQLPPDTSSQGPTERIPLEKPEYLGICSGIVHNYFVQTDFHLACCYWCLLDHGDSWYMALWDRSSDHPAESLLPTAAATATAARLRC